MIDRGKHNVLGVRIDAVDYDAAVSRVIAAARERRPYAVSALAVHGVMTGVLDRTHRHRLNQFDMLVPDGQPVRWALNRLHRTKLADRVYGPNLMLRVCERAAAENLPIFLYGSTSEVLAALRAKLVEQFPALIVAGTRPSLFRKMQPGEREEIAGEIRRSGAALTFVALGCPRQEVYAYEMKNVIGMPLLAVGAAFPFHAGLLAQAPRFYQDRGLEWLYRLVKEPRRLWRRYVFLNPLYVAMLLGQMLRLRTLDPDRTSPPRADVCYG
ncbi:MAG: WecB/TagA/CpsF family glycosyltransferase [Gemmataceae bacterium]